MDMRKSKVGSIAGRLKVLDEWVEGKYYKAKCICNCGNITIIHSNSLRNQVSCGCYMKERISEIHSTHKKSSSSIYKRFYSIKSRCDNKSNSEYPNYGGRGIACEWRNFEEFYSDMMEGYIEGGKQELDRINNDGNYCKSNCRWVSHTINNRNKRSNVFYKGKCVSEWCEVLGLNRSTVFVRIFRGKTIAEALK